MARVTGGAISLSNSSHLPPIVGSKLVSPVRLPPGCARLATKPLPTGSPTCRNTIGIERCRCRKLPPPAYFRPRRRSGDRRRSALSRELRHTARVVRRPSGSRSRGLRPSDHPSFGSPAGTPRRARLPGRSTSPTSTPMRRIRSAAARAPPAATRRRAAEQRDELAALSFDHLVGAGEQDRWDVEAERFRGGEVEDQIEFGRLLDREDRRASPRAKSCRHSRRRAGTGPDSSLHRTLDHPLRRTPEMGSIVGSRAPSANVLMRIWLAFHERVGTRHKAPPRGP